MNIAYILAKFPSLYTTFILNDMINLVQKGNRVVIFSIHISHDNIIHKGSSGLIKNTYYFDELIVTNNGCLTRAFIEVARKFRRYNPFYRAIGKLLFKNKVDNINEGKYFKNFGWKIYAFSRIANKLKRDHVDIIHGGFGNGEATAAMILSDMTEIPFTFETHAKDLFVNFPYSQEKIEKAKTIFTISNYNKYYLMENLNCPESKIVIKRVPFNKKYCDQVSEKDRTENLIVSVCRLHPIKGLDYAIEAVKEVSKTRRNVKYVIIGDGPLKTRLADKVTQLSMDDRVTFLGEMSNERALDVIARSSIVLLPSVVAPNGDRDGIPTSLIEAMYLKTPVVSSRLSGIPELIDDGVNGFLTEPGNVKQIAEKLEALLSSKTLRTRTGEKAREKVNREFDIADNSQKLLDGWTA